MIALEGCVVVVGGSRGIGAAAARYSAQAGANVAVIYRSDRDAAESVVREIEALGRKFLAVQADASEEGALGLCFEAAKTLGPLTGLVVSAGIFEGKPLEAMDVEFWDRTMAVNVRATYLAVKEYVKVARPQGQGGSIVIYTSTAGQRGSAVYSAYATSKGAQIMFMRSMALELAPDHIRVNCIAPAWTVTDMARPSLEKLGFEEVAKDFPLGRIGLPEDVAGATVFLLSPLAGFITGMTLTVDGGMDMRG